MTRNFFDVQTRREKRREYQRKYNQSEKGKVRHRRWRRSRQGKAKLRKGYKERKEWLSEIKRKRGCVVRGETDPRVLRFCPRDHQKIKFLPILQNTSRSLKDWREVIRRCDVICLNCLAKKKAPGKSGRTRKVEEVREVPEMPQESTVNASLRDDLQVSRPNPTSVPADVVEGRM